METEESAPTHEEILAALQSLRVQPPPAHMMTLQQISDATGRARSTLELMARRLGLTPQLFKRGFKPAPHYDVRDFLPRKSV